MILKDALYKRALIVLLIAELLSFVAWTSPELSMGIYAAIITAIIVIALWKFEVALYIAIAELIIGSMGQMFLLTVHDFSISIRIGIWIAIMAVWFGKIITELIQKKKQSNDLTIVKKLRCFVDSRTGKWVVALGTIVLLGFIWGMIQNDFSNVFFDTNNWLFWLYLGPFITIFSNEKYFQKILSIGAAALTVIGIKTFFVLYFFSHGFSEPIYILYHWIRDTRVGEITFYAGNFWRTFFQSQIWMVIGLFIALGSWFSEKKNTIDNPSISLFLNFLFLSFFISIIVISFSRSFWVGILAGLGIFLHIVFSKSKRRFLETLKWAGRIGIVVGASVLLVYGWINLPPRTTGDFGNILEDRLTGLDAAGSSRLHQLKPLTYAIIKHPIIGSGLGATVTYKTQDPRVVSATPGGSGIYTTYAFEWGWLDMLLKFGLVGIIVYLGLILRLIKKLVTSYKLQVTSYKGIELGLLLALVAITTIHIFTPYLNHPLGIGFLILTITYTHQQINK